MFIKEKYSEEEEEETFIAEEIDEIYYNVNMVQPGEGSSELNMVQPGEGSSAPEVLYMGQDAKLQTWKATPFPVRRET